MQVSKINWLFNNPSGFYLIVALFLIDVSFLIFICNSAEQKLVGAMFGIYFFLLIIQKYPTSKKMFFLVLILFIIAAINNKKIFQFNLQNQDQVRIYPDQVQIKDNYLSGVASFKKGSILISGKVTSDQEKILKTGRPILLTQIEGEIAAIEPATNIGEFNFQNYYAAKRIQQKLKFTSCQMTTIKINNFFAWLHHLRFKMQSYFQKMPQLLGFFASELILGENNAQKNQEILNNYRNLGVIHLLSISGLHVGIYVLLLSTVCFYLKLTDGETFICCCLVLLLGIFLCQGQAGFVRASLSYSLGKLCKFNHCHINRVDILGLTAILHILIMPRLFMGVGAILSYVLALGLQLTDKFGKLQQSIMLNLLLTPLLLTYFYQVNVLTVLFNMLVVPYFNWVVLPVSFANIVIFNFNRNFSQLFERLLELGEKIIAFLSSTKYGLWTFGQIKWWQCLLLLIMTIILIIAIREKMVGQVNIKKLIGILTLFYLAFYCLIHFSLRGQVTFIDVGQGDSILVTTPFPRRAYLIDTGGKLNFSGKKQTPQLNRITIPFLKSQGISVLDGVFVSHQDADHVGDLAPLLEQVHVKKLYMAKGLIKNPSFQKRVKNRIKRTKLIELLAGMQIKEPQIIFDVVYPYQSGEGKNEDSLSLLFKLANKNWLFTGDLDQAGEKEIMQKMSFHVDYFKLGHHGSKTSSNPDFLQAIRPKMVFISAGRKNRFGHPHQETLNTLFKQQIPWVSTQDCGMISWYYGGMQSPKFEYFLKRGRR